MKKHLRNEYILYTLSFLVLSIIIFLPFILSGKTLVWDVDGIHQHFPILQFYGKLLRGIFTGKGFPLVNFNLGMGFDTISTLHYYALGDPLALLTIFMTPKNATFIYGMIIILRFYLIGISFILLCCYYGKKGKAIVLGALIYVFCGYALYSGVRHPYFTNSMIYLPLIIIGTEQLFRKKSTVLFTTMICISAVSNFYFFYILTFLMIFYTTFRYLSSYHKDYKSWIRGYFIVSFRIGRYYLMGICMSAVIFLPVIYLFFHNGRIQDKPNLDPNSLSYGKLVITVLKGVIAPVANPKCWTELLFPTVIIVCAAILLTNKSYRRLLIAVSLSLLGLVIPAFGLFMNGFAYVTNRWDFEIGLVIAVIFVMTYDKLFLLGVKEKILLVIISFSYGLLVFSTSSTDAMKRDAILVLLTGIILLLLQLNWFGKRRALQEVIIFITVTASIAFNGYAFYTPEYCNYSGQFLTKSEVDNKTKGALSLISEIKDSSFYRIETYGDKTLNESLLLEYNDVSGYFSLMDGEITTYFKELELLNQKSAIRIDNLDNRTILDALAGVKYVVTTDKTTAPYGYRLMATVSGGTKGYSLLENQFALPLGYTYTSYMLTQDYNKLSALEKQNAMMNAVILDKDNSLVTKTENDMSTGIQRLDYQIATDSNIVITGNMIKVKKAGASITLTFNSGPESETYVRFQNLMMKNASNKTFLTKGEKEVKKHVNVRGIYYNNYFGKVNYLVNTGYSKKGKTWVQIIFPTKSTYYYSGIEVYSLDMNYYKEQVKALSQSTLQNIKLSNNRVEGVVALKQNGILALSIPYSKGWTAYVDGVKTKLLKGNIMYMALPLEDGTHHIILTYVTPFLKIGGLISLVSLSLFIMLIIISRRKRGMNTDSNNLEQPLS